MGKHAIDQRQDRAPSLWVPQSCRLDAAGNTQRSAQSLRTALLLGFLGCTPSAGPDICRDDIRPPQNGAVGPKVLKWLWLPSPPLEPVEIQWALLPDKQMLRCTEMSGLAPKCWALSRSVGPCSKMSGTGPNVRHWHLGGGGGVWRWGSERSEVG